MEYRQIFSLLCEKIKGLNPDYIIHSGDVVHNKIQTSNEQYSLVSEFFTNLANIAPLIIIPGNHDLLKSNLSRKDSISPIVETLNNQDITYLKNSCEYPLNEDFVLNHLSFVDKENWVLKPTDPSKINIALYHGAVKGAKTDVGFVFERGDIDVSILMNFDFAFLGDIHKHQTISGIEQYRYCGSTITQNFGETDDKGFLFWEITKNNWSAKHITIPNPKPFTTIELTSKGKIPRGIEIKENSRIRLATNNNLPFDVVKKVMEVTKKRFNPESVVFFNRAAAQRGTIGILSETLEQENLRDIKVQEKLIREYLKDYEAEEEVLQEVFALNKKYNSLVEQDEEVARNVLWKINNFKFDNLFNYNKGNKIDFKKLDGVVGIFGKNFSGKSSIIDSILFTVFNSTSKNERKNLHIINQRKDQCQSSIEIEVGDDTYLINRFCEKYDKKLKGEITTEAKTEVGFKKINKYTGEVEILTQENRNNTDKEIRRVFGKIEDFLLTSMSSQFGSLNFLEEGSTKRKEILAKFLDLQIFEQKFQLAKEEATDIRGLLKRLEGIEYDEEIGKAFREVEKNKNNLLTQKEKCKFLKQKITEEREQRNKLISLIDSIPAEIIDIEKVKSDLGVREKEIERLSQENNNLKSDIENKKEKLKGIEKFLQEKFDVEAYREKKQRIKVIQQEISEIQNKLNKIKTTINFNESKAELLKEVPCGTEYPHCKFIEDAFNAKSSLENLYLEKEKLEQKKSEKEKTVAELNPEKINDYLEKYEQLIQKKNKTNIELKENYILSERNKTKTIKIKHEVDELREIKKEYEDNKDVIENLEHLVKDKKDLEKTISKQEMELENCENLILKLNREYGSAEQKWKNWKVQKQELLNTRREYQAIELFLSAMHFNGITYDIVKKALPVINAEISKVLANVVQFEVFFEASNNRLNIYIKHPKFEPRIVELASGAEKTLAAMAIRLALTKIGTLPKSNLFILDEPAVSLDEDHLDGFTQVLDMIKSEYDVVLLISHMEALKDCADQIITIEKTPTGFAKVNI